MPETYNVVYLGDSVYVARSSARDSIVLYTHNGIEKTNVIWLEPSVVEGLLKWIKGEI